MRLLRHQPEIDKVSKRVGSGQYLGRYAAARAGLWIGSECLFCALTGAVHCEN